MQAAELLRFANAFEEDRLFRVAKWAGMLTNLTRGATKAQR